MSDIKNIGLPKWPALVVIGKSISKEEAAEVLVRTNDWGNSCNDRSFQAEVWRVAGIFGEDEWHPDWEKLQAFQERLKILDLEYLHNSRIFSSWIGGPHGWCDWNGRIRTNNYNIGKWPSAETVLKEWEIIAKTFPFLSLKSQLFSGETGEEHSVPVIEFSVEKGEVSFSRPDGPLDVPDFNIEKSVWTLFSHHVDRERGCAIEQLKNALETTERRLKERP